MEHLREKLYYVHIAIRDATQIVNNYFGLCDAFHTNTAWFISPPEAGATTKTYLTGFTGLTSMICQTAPEERPETRIRFAESETNAKS
jgi:hypothetical protein